LTILGLKTQLLTHFSQHDIFDPQKHAVIVDPEASEYGREMLMVALTQLEEIGLVKKMVATESPVWVLVLPLNLVPQPVYIERDLANVMADLINHYNEMEEIDVECDPAKIDSADIGRLIDIIGNWEDEMMDENEDDDEDKPEKGGGLADYTPGVN